MSNNSTPTILMGRDDIADAISFGFDAYRFGKNTKSKRNHIIEVWAQGKLAEIAFSKFLDAQHNISNTLDFEIYDGFDEGDIFIQGDVPDYNLDVKYTKNYSNWMAVGERTYNRVSENTVFIQTQHDWECDIYERYSLNRDMPDDDVDAVVMAYLADTDSIPVSITGWAKKDELTHKWEQGEKPWSQNEKNYGMPLDSLNTDWDEFVNLVC